MKEEVLVNVCFLRLLIEYRTFLENLSFSSFSKLNKARCTNESVRKASCPMAMLYKRPINATLQNGGDPKPSSLERPTDNKSDPRQFSTLPPSLMT